MRTEFMNTNSLEEVENLVKNLKSSTKSNLPQLLH